MPRARPRELEEIVMEPKTHAQAVAEGRLSAWRLRCVRTVSDGDMAGQELRDSWLRVIALQALNEDDFGKCVKAFDVVAKVHGWYGAGKGAIVEDTDTIKDLRARLQKGAG